MRRILGRSGTVNEADVKPYIALWSAVLHKAVKDAAREIRTLRKDTHKSDKNPWDNLRLTSKRHMPEALRWLHSDDKHVGSCAWVCSMLGHDQERVIATVFKQWRNL
jgi:hypothetical protein